MATDLCPWLGSDDDRDLRGMEAHEAHVCYAQEPEADIELDYQAQFCLVGAHRGCQFYREPSAPPPPRPSFPRTTRTAMVPCRPVFPRSGSSSGLWASWL